MGGFSSSLLALWSSFLDKSHDLVKPGGKEIQRSDNTSIRTKLVLAHHFFVVDSVPNVFRFMQGKEKLIQL